MSTGSALAGRSVDPDPDEANARYEPLGLGWVGEFSNLELVEEIAPYRPSRLIRGDGSEHPKSCDPQGRNDDLGGIESLDHAIQMNRDREVLRAHIFLKRRDDLPHRGRGIDFMGNHFLDLNGGEALQVADDPCSHGVVVLRFGVCDEELLTRAFRHAVAKQACLA